MARASIAPTVVAAGEKHRRAAAATVASAITFASARKALRHKAAQAAQAFTVVANEPVRVLATRTKRLLTAAISHVPACLLAQAARIPRVRCVGTQTSVPLH